MTCLDAPLGYRVLCRIWHVPEGFATLLGALTTLLAGGAALLAAWLAWRGVQRQIGSAEIIAESQRHKEVQDVESGFTAELLVFSRTVIEATSVWNLRLQDEESELPAKDLPVLTEPMYFIANVGRIGRVRRPWAAAEIITFYGNLRELNEQSKEALATTGSLRVIVTAQSIVNRLHSMAESMSNTRTP